MFPPWYLYSFQLRLFIQKITSWIRIKVLSIFAHDRIDLLKRSWRNRQSVKFSSIIPRTRFESKRYRRPPVFYNVSLNSCLPWTRPTNYSVKNSLQKDKCLNSFIYLLVPKFQAQDRTCTDTKKPWLWNTLHMFANHLREVSCFKLKFFWKGIYCIFQVFFNNFLNNCAEALANLLNQKFPLQNTNSLWTQPLKYKRTDGLLQTNPAV